MIREGWCLCNLGGALHKNPQCPYYDEHAEYVRGDSANAHYKRKIVKEVPCSTDSKSTTK